MSKRHVRRAIAQTFHRGPRYKVVRADEDQPISWHVQDARTGEYLGKRHESYGAATKVAEQLNKADRLARRRSR